MAHKPAFVPDGEYRNQRYRYLYLVELIRTKGCPLVSELAERCGVSTKSIGRDLNFLRLELKAPIEYDPHRKGWYLTEKGYFLPLTFASDSDFQVITAIGSLISQYAGTPMGAQMRTAFERVLSAFRNEDPTKLKSIADKVAFASPPAAKFAPGVWDTVLTGLVESQELELEYFKGGNPPREGDRVELNVYEPYGLIVSGRDWFLHGYSRSVKHRQTLHLSYINSAKLRDEYFEVPPDFDLHRYAGTGVRGLHTENAKPETVVLKFNPEFANVIELIPFAHGQKLVRNKTGHAIITFEHTAFFQIERDVLSWGSKVEVIRPKKLREKVRDAAKEMVKKNK